jgi:hypothetical protein
MHFLRRLIPTTALALALTLAARAQVPAWPKTTPADVTTAGLGVQLTGADYGNGTFVLAAYFGGTTTTPDIKPAVFTSADGTTWTRRTLPLTGARVGKPRFLNGKFYLGLDAATTSSGQPTGTNGAVLSSADGITWTASTLSAPLYGPSTFAYGNGLYVGSVSGLSGATYQVVTSSDGVTWTPRAIGNGANFISSVTFFGGKFYAADFNAGVMASADGVTWAKVSGGPSGPNYFAATSSTLLVTVPGVTPRQSLSADGTTFTTASPGLSLSTDSMVVLNGAFTTAVAISASSSDNNQVVASLDGQTWTTIATTTNQYSAADLAYGNGRYVFVGEFEVFAGTTTVTAGGTAGSGGSGGGSGSTSGTVPTTLAELSAASLAGKSLNFTITGGNSPFESSGDFTLQLDTPSAGRYTIAVSSGSAAAHTDAYTYSARNDGAQLTLANYLSGQDGVGLSLFFAGTPTALATVGAGQAYFEMSAPGANKRGTFSIGSASGSGGTTVAAPTVSAQPAAQSGTVGGSITFTVTASGTGLSYQWYFNNTAISGAINATYTIASLLAADAGSYTVTITNSGGSVTSQAATLSVAAAGSAGAYLTNLSIRARAGTGDQTLIVGLTLGGAGTTGAKSVLVRGIGPALAGFGLASAITDPKLTAYTGSTAIGGNDNWVAGDVQAAANAVGAFPLTAGSKDAAFLGADVPAGSYSIVLEGVNGASGVALAELYDTTPAANLTRSTLRFTNVSSRTFVGAGDDTLICGFVVGGSGTRRVLVRAVGPGLAQFGLTGLLADPQLALFSGSTKIAENDNWNSATTLADQQSVGAFALPASSTDSVLVATVSPGAYTVTITGANGGTGVALIELYELP